MPLNDLIHHFNQTLSSGDGSLYLEHGRAAAWHRGLRLGSLFQPIAALADERIVGHQAVLLARQEEGCRLDAEAAYALCASPEAVVHFDRLVRTLHALNFLAQRRHAGGYLQLAVHPRHLLAIQNQHGLVYEAILKRCGLGPEDIVLEVDSHAVIAHPELGQALDNYRQRGYRIALGNLDSAATGSLLAKIRPNIVRLPPEGLPLLSDYASHGTFAIELSGIANAADLDIARQGGASLGQGGRFGQAQRDCRATHERRRVAYNSPSRSGGPHENRQ